MLEHHPVPGNRWDLLDRTPPEPRISVIVAHYNQELQLRRTCYALARQTLAPLEVIIADDGSSQLPAIPDTELATRVVSQPDLGFRAAAVRNLGVAACQGEVLVFLDADTAPEPDFLRRLTRRVALCRDVVAVGRRRHANLNSLPLDADPAGAPELDEPAWLRDGYVATHDLLHADGRSFRFVISAVLACRRSLYAEVGGFDERFVGYGGEDWDFGYRAWNAGAVLVHEPTAVAWHDGPEWAARSAIRNHDRQSVRLAVLIPEPSTRGAPLPRRLPDVLVDVQRELDPSAVIRCVHSLLRQDFADLQVRAGVPADELWADLYRDTLRSSPWDPDQLRRARAHLSVKAPLPPHALRCAMDAATSRDLGVVRLLTGGQVAAVLTSTRASARARRWADVLSTEQVIDEHFGRIDLEVGAAPMPGGDLAAFFAAWP